MLGDHVAVAGAPVPTHGSVSSLRCWMYSSWVGRSDTIDADIRLRLAKASSGERPCSASRPTRSWVRLVYRSVAHDTQDVGVLGQHEGVGAGRHATACDAQHRGIAVEDLVRLVPVFLRPVAEQVDVGQMHRTRHWTQLVIHLLRRLHHTSNLTSATI